ncbi:HNH endonuclease [Azohydromonas aeria]|uniref:HNH endonuclease n=1 Tax=Azohydromonas aeria TaxID=2590212 RepID=UPI0012F7ED52|nr:HNH endonuclease [Azohydromonas aeria]
MTTERKSISKKTRFEVFKRDGFKCQYCGAAAPDVLLQVDHIHPVSQDGDNDMMNFITSCQPCNAGKSDRLLSDDTAIKKQQAQMEVLHERREQLEMMLQWREGLKDIEGDQIDAIAKAWQSAVKGSWLTDNGLQQMRKLLKRHGLPRVLDAIDTAAEQYVVLNENGKATTESAELAISKVGGICALAGAPEDERRLYYVRGILNNRLSYVPARLMGELKAALKAGVPVDDMVEEAKSCSSWTAFKNWLYDQYE